MKREGTTSILYLEDFMRHDDFGANHYFPEGVDSFIQNQQKLRSLHAELSKAEESERKRIADLLHDSVAQYLSLANIKLSSLLSQTDNPRILNTIQDSARLISQSIRETRELIYELNLPILRELGLVSALNWKKTEWEKNYTFEIIIRSRFQEKELSLDNKVLAFRIIAELVTNVSKHAQATLVTIRVKGTSGYVECLVADNGVGFSKALSTSFSNQSGYGLFRIKERLELASGSITVESKAMKGTRIRFYLPKI